MNRRDLLKTIGGFAFLPLLSFTPKLQKKKRLWSRLTGLIEHPLFIDTWIETDDLWLLDHNKPYRRYLWFPAESILELEANVDMTFKGFNYGITTDMPCTNHTIHTRITEDDIEIGPPSTIHYDSSKHASKFSDFTIPTFYIGPKKISFCLSHVTYKPTTKSILPPRYTCYITEEDPMAFEWRYV